MIRREFNRNLGLISIGALSDLHSCILKPESKNPSFFIVSSWQKVNIGDIAHTPGLLSLIDQYFPKFQD